MARLPEGLDRLLTSAPALAASGAVDPLRIATQLNGMLGGLDRAHKKQAVNILEGEVEVARLQSALGGGDVPWHSAPHLLEQALGKTHADMIAKYREELRSLSGRAHKEKLKELRGLVHRIIRQDQKQTAEIDRKKARIERYDHCAAELHRWMTEPLILQRLEESHLGELRVAEIERNLFSTHHKGRENWDAHLIQDNYGDAEAFVVGHDWARAFENSPDVFTDAVALPASCCAFEFRISGKVVVCHVMLCDDNPMLMATVKAKEGWVMMGNVVSRRGQLGYIKTDKAETNGLVILEQGEQLTGQFIEIGSNANIFAMMKMLDRQIRAICVALDAQVATKTAQRMPYKSNMPKAERQAKPFYSYNTVSLTRRPARLERREDDGLHVPGTKRALHFRRGHWRHFDGWKTWVNWCLVGDPDVGFVDKHYKL